VVDTNRKLLTVYDGVSYGFYNYLPTPEPATALLMGAALAAALLRKRLR